MDTSTPTPAAIPIRNRQKQQVAVAVVDAADRELVSRYSWRLHKGYARGYRDGRSIFMHRLVLSGILIDQVDHINRDRLDNRRANLRVCTAAENAQNLGARRGERGVSWDATDNKWIARVQRHRGSRLFRKRFDSFPDAVAAVKHARAALMPFSQEATCQ